MGAGLVVGVAADPVDLGQREPQLGRPAPRPSRPAAATRSARPGERWMARWRSLSSWYDASSRDRRARSRRGRCAPPRGRPPRRVGPVPDAGDLEDAAGPRQTSRTELGVGAGHARRRGWARGWPGPRRPARASASRTVGRETPSDSARATSRSGVPDSSSPSKTARRSSSATRSTVEECSRWREPNGVVAGGAARWPAHGAHCLTRLAGRRIRPPHSVLSDCLTIRRSISDRGR